MLYKCLLLLAHFAKITDLVFKQTLGKWEDLSLFALWPNCLQKKTNHGSRNKRVRTKLKSNCHNSTTTSNKFCCPQWVWWRTGFDACFNLQLLVHVDEAEPLTLTRTRWSLSTWWSTLKIISSDHSVAFMLPRNWFFPDKHTSALLPYWSMHRILGWHVWLRTTW